MNEIAFRDIFSAKTGYLDNYVIKLHPPNSPKIKSVAIHQFWSKSIKKTAVLIRWGPSTDCNEQGGPVSCIPQTSDPVSKSHTQSVFGPRAAQWHSWDCTYVLHIGLVLFLSPHVPPH